MQVAAHSRRSLAVCVAAAGVVAMAPVTVPDSVPTPPALTSAAVQLTAAYDPLEPWIQAFETAYAGADQIGESFSEAPAILLRQFLSNQAGYLEQVLKNPGKLGDVIGQVLDNARSAVQAATLFGVDPGVQTDAGLQTLDGWHAILLQSIPKILPEGTPPQVVPLLKEVLNLVSSPVSGIAMGLIGPLASPAVALANSLHAVVTSVLAGDLAGAVQDLINIPAKMVDAFLNGATLNLDGLVPMLNAARLLTDTTLHNLDIEFGGLFSAGVTGIANEGIGGSIFNAIGMNTTTGMMGFPLTLDIAGQRIGPLAALVTFGQIIAKAIGWPGVTTGAATAATAETAELTNDSPTALPNASAVTVSLSTHAEGTPGGSETLSAATETDSDEQAEAELETKPGSEVEAHAETEAEKEADEQAEAEAAAEKEADEQAQAEAEAEEEAEENAEEKVEAEQDADADTDTDTSNTDTDASDKDTDTGENSGSE
ncbi:outer membrane porin GjpA [Mycobacterium sp. NPDC003323]